MKCGYCESDCVKNGKRTDGTQKYHCKVCGKYQQAKYKSQAWKPETTNWIVSLTQEGCGINNIKRLLRIAKGTVLRRIREVAGRMGPPEIADENHVIEIDEMSTYVGNKQNPSVPLRTGQVYVCYALVRGTGRVVAFNVGKRSKVMIRPVVEAARALKPKAICTDGLNIYPGLVTGCRHIVGKRATRRIERMNLAIRTNSCPE